MIIYWDNLEKSANDDQTIPEYMASNYVPSVHFARNIYWEGQKNKSGGVTDIPEYIKSGHQNLYNKTLTNPAINGATGTGALNSKIKTASRDMTAEPGDVEYTGVGFKPTSIIALGTINGTYTFSIGLSDMAKADFCMMVAGSVGLHYLDGAFISLRTAAGYQDAVIKSYDNDGFTLTWGKSSSPTGTAGLLFLCFK